ncbi:hypothetical protein [Vibrio phage VP41s3]|nr:hypothetical protein [Vibrio phage VP41s3]
MKKSVIDIVQDMLNDTDGDEVNSIDDTAEATQAAYILRSTFENIITNSTIDFYRRGIQFDGVSDVLHPNYLKLPDNVQQLELVKYDCSTDERAQFKDIQYLYPDEFLDRQNRLDSTKDNVQKVRDYDGIVYLVQTDKAPEFWTSFDDEYIIFDSFNKKVENTIHKNKTQGIAYVSPTFLLEDDYIPDLPADMFPYLISEAKAAFASKIRQARSEEDAKWATLHRRRMSRKNWQAKGGIRTPNYGRIGKLQGKRKNPYFA